MSGCKRLDKTVKQKCPDKTYQTKESGQNCQNKPISTNNLDKQVRQNSGKGDLDKNSQTKQSR